MSQQVAQARGVEMKSMASMTAEGAAAVAAKAAGEVPEGYELLVPPPGFVAHTGVFYVHKERPVLATRVTGNYLNSIRIAHGGFLATLVDTAFGVVIRRQLGLPVPPATVSLSLDYIGAVREGDWAEAQVEVYKAGRRLTNANCLVKVGERTTLRASGVFIMA